MLKTNAITALGVMISAAATGLALNHASNADDSVHSLRAGMTEDRAREALLTVGDLPYAWVTDTAREDNGTLGDFGLRPESCAHAASSLEKTSETWEDARIKERAAFTTSTDSARLEQTITHDRDLRPDDLVNDLNDLIAACPAFTVDSGDGMTYAGTITAEDLGQGDDGVGLVQTWTGSTGTIVAYFEYLIDGRTITTLNATTNGTLSAEAFEAIVAEASDNL